MRGFKILQIPEQAVILGIGNRRRIKNVVRVFVALQLRAQGCSPRGWVLQT
jgi:hypothetical protein